MPDEPLPPPPPPVKKKTWWQNVVSELVDLVEAIIEFTADPVVAKRLISDLGVDVSGPIPNANIPMTEVQNLREYAENTDVTAEAFAATVEQAAAIVEALITFVKSLDGDLTEEEAFDLFMKLTGTFATETVKARYPTLYWMMKSLALFSEQFGNVERFDFDAFGSLFNSEADDGTPGFTEFEATRWSDLFTFAVQQVLGNVALKLGPGHSESDVQWLDSYYGWETPPEHADRVDIGVLERMWTIRIKSGPGEADPSVAITIALVPVEHGGPGFFVSIGGRIGLSREINDNILSISTALDGALKFFVYTGDDGSDRFQIGANSDLGQAIDVSYRPKVAEFPIEVDPIFRWEPGGKVLFKVQQLAFAANASFADETICGGVDLIDAQIVVRKDALSILEKLLRDDLDLKFGAGIRWDPQNGIHFTNGSGFHTLVPLNRTAYGFTVHYVEVAVQARENQAKSLEVVGTTAVTIELGPIKAQIERFGVREYINWGDDRGYESGFQPPKGIALSIKSGGLKGGGYLFIDPVNNEYSGVLELTYGKFSLKAIGILTTEVPGFPDDWAFFALVTAEFPPWGPISGVGGLVGVHHGLSIENLQNGVRTGVLDSILFPKDPTANPAQVINHIRAVFPVTPGALTVGLMLKLAFFGGKLEILLGLVMQWNNAIGNDDTDASLNRVSVIGRLQIIVPADAAKPKVKIILDIAGSYDFPAKLLSVDGRLRDSKIGSFTITGSGSVRDQGRRAAAPGLPAKAPSRIVTVGGWNPRFKDIPEGVPKQDRVGFSIKSKKGAKTKYELSVKAYYASTPNTTQIGLTAKASGSKSGFKFSGTFGFDGIWYENPDYFELDVKFGVSIKKGSTNLLTIDLELYVRGSGHWIVKGEGKIKILWWSIPIPIHEEWGSELPATTETIMVEEKLAAAVTDYRNWEAHLPDNSEMLVTMRELTEGDQLFAHPLGNLSFTQQVVPLGLKIDKFGQFIPEGADRFDITEVTVGGSPEVTTKLKSFFSLHEFLDLSAEDRLTLPSFEQLGAGVAINVSEDALPGITEVVSAEPNYELKYRRRPIADAIVVADYEVVLSHAGLGAAARSNVGRNRFGGGQRHPAVVVAEPTVVVVAKDTLETQPGTEADAYITAVQGLDDPGHQVIESHELEPA